MDLFAYTLNHRNTGFETLETVLGADARPAVQAMLRTPSWLESLSLATCLRFELYGVGTDPEPLLRACEKNLAIALRLDPSSLRGTVLLNQEAVRHLLGVAAGLESILWGETSITAQVRRAYREGVDAGECGAWLHRLFHTALRGSRSIRQEAGVVAPFRSLGAMAVATLPGDFGGSQLGDLAAPIGKGESRIGGLTVSIGQSESRISNLGAPIVDGASRLGNPGAPIINGARRLVVVGAGEAGRAVLEAARSRGFTDLHLVSTQRDAATALAEEFGATAHEVAELEELLSRADSVVTASSRGKLVSRELLARAISRRPLPTPIHIVDLGRPANVAPEVDELPGVKRLGLASLAATLPPIDSATRRTALAVRERTASEYEAWRRGRSPEEQATARSDKSAGRVYLVGAGPGDPELLTLKAARLLERSDIVFHDALVPASILDTIPRGVQRVPVGRRKGHVVCEQEDVHRGLIAWALRGAVVVRLKGGDPMVFGRGGEEVRALHEAGVEVIVVPGITAATAAAASIQAGLTQRGLSASCGFVSLHQAGSEDPEAAWEHLLSVATVTHTLAIYMGGTKLHELGRRLLAAGRNPKEVLALVERSQLPDERVRWITLTALAEEGAYEDVATPAVVLLGASVEMSPRRTPIGRTKSPSAAYTDRVNEKPVAAHAIRTQSPSAAHANRTQSPSATHPDRAESPSASSRPGIPVQTP